MTEMLVQAAARDVTEAPFTTKIIQLANIPDGAERWDPCGGTLVLAGSWNPPHAGHEALLSTEGFRNRVALVSTFNADKPPLSREEVVDRLRMMELALPGCYTAATNVPLLMDQAKLFRAMWPSSRAAFAMGWDTWVRFNDPGYLGAYHDAAIEEFFRNHRVVVGTRGGLTPASAMLELRSYPFRDRVRLVDPLGYKDMSSTEARMHLAEAKRSHQVKPEVCDYALAAGLYREAKPG